MGDNWDDDDFEPEVSTLAPPPEPEPVAVKPAEPSQSNGAAKKKAPVFAMESLGRELSGAEKEAIQKEHDLALAREMFGGEIEGGDKGYADIVSKEDFEFWGEKIGAFLSTRHKAGHYGDMISRLLNTLTEKLDATDIRKMSNYLKTIADSKKTEVKKAAVTVTKKATKKAQLKSNKATTNDMYEDYGGDGGDYDDYDDFM